MTNIGFCMYILGNYYLCDNDYALIEGFLAPYKGVKYHPKEWGPKSERPQNPQEMFNLRHSRARNVIERAFAILRTRWGILRSAPNYEDKVNNRLVMACFLLHNFVRNEMQVDPIELEMDDAAAEIGDEEQFGFDVYAARDAIAENMWMSRGA